MLSRAFEFGLDYRWEAGIQSLLAMGWPGLLIGAGVGLFAWRQHRLTASGLGAGIGMCLWIGIHIVPF